MKYRARSDRQKNLKIIWSVNCLRNGGWNAQKVRFTVFPSAIVSAKANIFARTEIIQHKKGFFAFRILGRHLVFTLFSCRSEEHLPYDHHQGRKQRLVPQYPECLSGDKNCLRLKQWVLGIPVKMNHWLLRHFLLGGGPGNATNFLSLDLVKMALGQFDLGPAAAMSLIYFLIVLLICWVFYSLMMKNEGRTWKR